VRPFVPGRVSRLCLWMCQPETKAKAKWSGLIQARQRHHTLRFTHKSVKNITYEVS
jgi:hypothetical protein